MALSLLSGCRATKHVPDGEYLLDKVNITVDDRSDIDTRELYNFLRQMPNHKVLGFAKLQLATYNLSGRDSLRWYNRWLRSLGKPPVIYDSLLTAASARQLRLALINKGYLRAEVTADTISCGRKKMEVIYHIDAGRPNTVAAIAYDIPDTAIRRIIMADTARSLLHTGMLLDRNALDSERDRLSRRLRNSGYYDFSRDYITYTADTIAGSLLTGLLVNIRARGLKPTTVGRVMFVLTSDTVGTDTVCYKDKYIVYGHDKYLKPKILDEMCYIEPGKPYSAAAVERTYEALGRLGIVRYLNIEMEPAADGTLTAVITTARNKKQSAAIELEGTNSEGDLGFGVGLTYQHRNLARSSELLTAKLRTSYESLSGNFEGLVNNRYTEVAAEVGITFPKFECPFLSKSFKQKMLVSTEFALTANYQERPEYTRVIFGGAWRWKWQHRLRDFMRRQTYDLIDINYVRLPRSTIDFIDEIAPENPLLRYSYEDHFIMRMGYTYTYTNRRAPDAGTNVRAFIPHVTTLRFSAETAGNLLYAISNLVGQHRSDGVYKVLGIQYAQYVKGDIDYSYTRNFNDRNALAMRVGFGIAYPYGNSSMVPFEKRFYAGGANSVRGWGVRTLGPGSYDARNSVTDFINQCGDIRLDLGIEYRAKLFWVLEGALFIDAGNIWTIKNYENQPGGEFKFNQFYKQIAAAYGVGIRLDFTYFLLRLDLGFKAHNPAMNQERWPLFHPKWSRDANFHFSVGYPF